MRRTALLSAALLITAACSDTPLEPTPRPELTVSEVTPASGATLTFQDCGAYCVRTEQIQTAFDVLIRGDMPEATVVVSLRQGDLACASARILTALSAGSRTPFRTSSVSMDYGEDGQLLCPTPTESTTLRFAVYFRNSPARPVVSHELPYRFTLARQ